MTMRITPNESDRSAVRTILAQSGFFNSEEVEVGVSLIDEFLKTGEASGYLFLFAEEDSKVVGYTCYGPIPGTRFSFDLYWIAVDGGAQGKIGRAHV